MVDRIQLLHDVYMKVDGQWAIVLSGSVIDVPDKAVFAGKHVSVLSPGEPAGALAPHGGPTPVRSLRRK